MFSYFIGYIQLQSVKYKYYEYGLNQILHKRHKEQNKNKMLTNTSLNHYDIVEIDFNNMLLQYSEWIKQLLYNPVRYEVENTF